MKSKLNPKRRWLIWSVIPALSLILAAGCGQKAQVAAPTSANDSNLTDSRIQSIQNDPRMSPAEKEKAIAVLKSRQH